MEIEENIVQIEYTSDKLRLSDITKLAQEIRKIKKKKKKKIGLLTILRRYIAMDKAVIRYMRTSRFQRLMYASAIVVESIPIQASELLFRNFQLQRIPHKIFNSKRKALSWLKAMYEK